MPFKKILDGPDKGKYRSSTGIIMTHDQVIAYYVQNPKPKRVKRIRDFSKQPSPPSQKD